ncbi:MAG: HEAT repeat domain-containing protein, partial [Planctomycetota bacterium]
DKVTLFADDLNIPIGLLPYKKGVIAFSIPYIYFLEDTDGDDRADKREILYGPMGFDRDTHGLNNAFRRGFDGWVYVCHGHANHSKFQGKDGSVLDIQSGNTYRIRPDGTRVEPFAWGQVNPFGLTFDPRGDLFSADCHTKPIMLLLRNGYYDSFGKPHNGLGYVPAVMEHLHGSTAIAGTTCYTGDNFPPEFRENMFCGNVMTSRVNRDTLRFVGSTIQAVEQPDFLISDDPWFRPVDLQVGPDGALYVADFYNRIIAHVEVPLNHPGRDKARARIWRISYAGPSQGSAKRAVRNLRAAEEKELLRAFEDPNLGVRMRATDEWVDRSLASKPLRDALRDHANANVRVHSLWGLHRLGDLSNEDVIQAASDKDPVVQTHAMRVLSETFPWSDELDSLAIQGLTDADPFVRRSAVDALGRHPRNSHLGPLFALWNRTPPDDVHLIHAIRMTLLEEVRQPGTLSDWSRRNSDENDRIRMSAIALAVQNEEAAAFLLDTLRRHASSSLDLKAIFTHVAKHLPSDSEVTSLPELVQNNIPQDLDLQLDLLLAVRNGLQQRGKPEPEEVRVWGKSLAHRLLQSVGAGANDWKSMTQTGAPGPDWKLEPRNTEDGKTAVPFLSSLPLGEGYRGTLRSREFDIPKQLQFYLCGHLGFPDQPPQKENVVRLRMSDTGEVAREVEAPRNDTARRVTWDLGELAGKRGYLEIVDGLNVNGYAWLAISGIEPPVVSVPDISPEVVARRQRYAAMIAESLGLSDLQSSLAAIVRADYAEIEARLAASKALRTFQPNPRLAALAELLREASMDPALKRQIAEVVASGENQDFAKFFSAAMRSAPNRAQVLAAERLSETQAGAEQFLTSVQAGDLAPRLLQLPAVRERLESLLTKEKLKEMKNLLASLPPLDQETEKLLSTRRDGYQAANPSVEKGKELFVKNCSGCHQIAGKGAVLAPQLDGIGSRGLERVLEDVLDPNRNVDPAFHVTIYELDDGRVLTGLLRRREGQSVVIADNKGQEISFPRESIVEERKSRLSLMPTNFATALNEAEFNDLLCYLLAQ